MANNLFELYNKVNKHWKENPHLRYGQALMNILAEVNKPIYDALTNTSNDPFYWEDNHPSFPKMYSHMEYLWYRVNLETTWSD